MAFFALRINREYGREKPTSSVIVGHSYDDRWIESPEEVDKAMDEMKANSKENQPPYTALKAAQSIFGRTTSASTVEGSFRYSAKVTVR
nr:hypothetical protein [uncultured Dethiosulfovibrio sp.]